ncbi:hypothetical protein [Xanthovirga aplysinae]|uniref:hypothetical protein n=1 Tax=Xanthovirga aplysinae TaxID=2529853 RepID=UPI0012BB6045|nr:hypothetical protein [Xanthovirga aplysinae]MTI31447.1 hypothetical protein [Xanthovirga aplysinae]
MKKTLLKENENLIESYFKSYLKTLTSWQAIQLHCVTQKSLLEATLHDSVGLTQIQSAQLESEKWLSNIFPKCIHALEEIVYFSRKLKIYSKSLSPRLFPKYPPIRQLKKNLNLLNSFVDKSHKSTLDVYDSLGQFIVRISEFIKWLYDLKGSKLQHLAVNRINEELQKISVANKSILQFAAYTNAQPFYKTHKRSHIKIPLVELPGRENDLQKIHKIQNAALKKLNKLMSQDNQKEKMEIGLHIIYFQAGVLREELENIQKPIAQLNQAWLFLSILLNNFYQNTASLIKNETTKEKINILLLEWDLLGQHANRLKRKMRLFELLA